jgi:Porin subfamily
MRNILLAIVIAILPAMMAVAEPAGTLKLEKSTPLTKLLPVKGASAGNSCAAYGPGFRKVEGTDTCVKVGGAVSVEVGGSR